MNKCLYCYQEIKEGNDQDYHSVCCKAFFGTSHAPILTYKLSEIEDLAKQAAMMSITVPGVQPKLSLGWVKSELADGHQGRLTIMNALEGNYILKPQNALYYQMPENEHLTMKIAALFKITIVPVNLIRLVSGELCYITKRIDRNPGGSKNHLIDFMQILELDDKYKGTMERLGKSIGELSANSLLDKLRFFELAVFNYLIGNNDMHLKNFSMLLTDNRWTLSPAYDLLNVKMILPQDKEDFALMIGGKKMNFNKSYFERFGSSLNLNQKQITAVFRRLEKWLPLALELIDMSFLNIEHKETYKNLIYERVKIFE
ncbi:MAG TPA: HipA domain-containing protein [Saprospiraceae bacterium]|nr:HipA domain-containing protein [Saprospiraceae bacterium]HRG40006.1 HipA domain-containing protein [Saprospiraceae bacterium]